MDFKFNFERLFQIGQLNNQDKIILSFERIWEKAIANTANKASFWSSNYEELFRNRAGIRRYFFRTFSPQYLGFQVEDLTISLATEIYSDAGVQFVIAPEVIAQISSIFTKEWWILLNKNQICREDLLARHGQDITGSLLNSFKGCSQEIFSLLPDRHEVFRKYFASYSQENGLIGIDIYLPSKIDGAVEYSNDKRVIVPVQLLSERDVEMGFFRIGFEYRLSESQTWLKQALLSLEDFREIADFENFDIYNQQKYQEIWKQ